MAVITNTTSNVDYVETRYRRQLHWSMMFYYTNDNGDTKVIEAAYPLTCQFRITRNTLSNSNTAEFSFYNLAPATRANIYQDRFLWKNKFIRFYVGYQSKLVEVFFGQVQEAYTHREKTDIITRIQAMDIGMTNSSTQFCITFPAGTTYKEAYIEVLNRYPLVTTGITGTIAGTFQTDTTLVGTPLEVLNKITNGHTFIDNGEVRTLQDNEACKLGVTILNSDMLLQTPRRTGASLIATSLLNPDLLVGQLVEIQSNVANEFDGTYMLAGVDHQGSISYTQQSQCTSTLNLLIGSILPNPHLGTQEEAQKEGFMQATGDGVEPVNGRYGKNIEEVYRYIKDQRGDVSGLTLKINNRISWKDMLQCTGSLNTNADINLLISKDILYNCQTIANKLNTFVNTYYPQAKIYITSGWRTPANNALYNNASGESQHLKGNAIDFILKGVPTKTAYKNVFNPYWDKFCYLFYPSGLSSPVIHVQATLGKGGAKRA